MKTTNLRALRDGDAAHHSADLSEMADAIATALKGLRYGSIEVVVHDGRGGPVVRTQKRRIAK
jgi:hypothetical protein